uniref:Uncharacterized protein n=1 Tax=Panagrellus redivivus TaxID=6233 RepID=A0A7E4VFH1_PANRE
MFSENITSNIDLARQIGNLEAATFPLPPEKQQHNEDKLPTSPQRKRVSSPAAVVRSFSGQFNVTKVSPSMRRMNKINSQIIMFNGQPHFQVENLDRRAMHNDLVKRLK